MNDIVNLSMMVKRLLSNLILMNSIFLKQLSKYNELLTYSKCIVYILLQRLGYIYSTLIFDFRNIWYFYCRNDRFF
jgi:hypothetical protein